MNLDELGASFQHNRTAILGTAAAGVVGFALYKRKQAGVGAAGPAQGVAAVPAYSAGSQAAGMYGANAYDSSASDVYGLVQPQLESLGQQVTDLGSKLNAVPVSAAPAPTPTSNKAWEAQAIKGWTDQGGNALDMQYALSQYLQAQPINSAQQSGINWAVHNFGAAPEGAAGNSPIVRA